jgi:hypothetical protein
MRQVVGAIIFIVLGYLVLALAAQHLPPAWQAGVPFHVPLIAVAGGAWAFARRG